MITLDWGPVREARYWQEIVAAAVYPPIRRIEHVIDATTACIPRRDGTLEVLVPTGARSLYGLLGGTYEPHKRGALHIVVNVGAPKGTIFPDSLASGLDEVHVGLPEEYSKAVLESLVEAQLEGHLVPSGTFTIVCAAHGLVGSSSDFFGRLAWGLIRGIESQSVNPSELSLTVRKAMWDV